EGAVVDGSSPWFRDVDGWLTPEGRQALSTCHDLEWAGLSDVAFPTHEGAVVRLVAVDEPRGWRLTCLEDTVRAHLDETQGQIERIHVLTDFAGAVARELIDPMSIVQAKIELMLDLGIADPVLVRRHLEIALQHAERVSQVLDNLRRISQPKRLPSERWSVAALFEEVMDQLGAPLRPKVKIQVESALSATGPRAIVARVVASLVRSGLQRRSDVVLAARTQRVLPTILVGPTSQRRGSAIPLRPSMTSHQPLVVHLGGHVGAFSDGQEEWVELALPRPPPGRPRRVTQGVHLLALGSSGFRDEAQRRLGPHGIQCIPGARRQDVVEALRKGRVDMVLAEVDLEGPGPRGHALMHGLSTRHPDVDFFVAITGADPAGPLGRIHIVRWPADADEIVRVARNEA
ncbi:MAG: hypothetical protein AAF602_13385, partial [Myxococcota bacterium]